MKSPGLNIILACSLLSCAGGAFAATNAQTDGAAESATTATPPSGTPPATAEAVAPDGTFATDQLEQLVAPIALYPDALLMQILMAATYPLEIVQADRFVKQNPDLTGDALDQALLDEDWDPSVKSLVKLPSVLKQMSENLDWTQDLGDAFLGQQNETLDTVQRLRGKAYEAGNLQSTEQQVVTQEADQIIVIQSAAPEVIYVPTYSPTVVYGPGWGYPSYYYPPMYPYYPPGYGLVSFGVGVAVGAAIWGGASWGWGRNEVDIDINRYNEFNRTTNINADRDRINVGQGGRGDGNKASWQHDASHRKGVNYKSPEVAQRNGASAGSNRATKDQARGRSSASTGNRATAGTSQAGNRSAGSAQTRDRSSGSPGASTSQADRSSAARSSQMDRSSASNRSPQASSQASRNSAFSGSRSPSADRMSSSRGASSRGTTSFGGARGGARRR
jgi:hypothetical protein